MTGDVADFDTPTTSALASTVAQLANVNVSDVSIDVASGSVHLVISIAVVHDNATAAVVASTMRERLADLEKASIIMGVDVTSTPKVGAMIQDGEGRAMFWMVPSAAPEVGVSEPTPDRMLPTAAPDDDVSESTPDARRSDNSQNSNMERTLLGHSVQVVVIFASSGILLVVAFCTGAWCICRSRGTRAAIGRPAIYKQPAAKNKVEEVKKAPGVHSDRGMSEASTDSTFETMGTEVSSTV